MSVQTDKLPPVPQLVAPLTSQIPGKWELKDLRFESSWLQWFIQLRAKVDVINESLVSFGRLGSGVGLIVQTGAGTFLARSILGTSGRVSVTNGSGESGNITINIDSNVAFRNVANVWAAGQAFNSDATFNGTVDFNLSPTYNVPDIIDAVDDAAAATAGVPVGGTYRTGSVLKLRVV
jgi:hypothetical protein